MASGQTTNFGLNQWAAEDKVVRQDFNQDNAKIDTALGQLKTSVIQTAVGSYVGNGLCGSENPNHLEFDFAPKLVVLVVNTYSTLKTGTVLVAGQTISAGIGTSYSSGSCLNLTVTWAGNGVTWYAGDEERQLNEADTTYFYFAIG